MSKTWKIFLAGVVLRFVPTENIGELMITVACCMWLAGIVGDWLVRYAKRKEAEVEEK